MAVRTKTTVGVAVAIVMVAAAAAHAVVVAPPTVAECAQLQLKSPNFRGSRLAATVFCLRPSSIQTTASVTWTTCPTTPTEEPCAEGAFSVSFRSTGNGADPDSWGGEDFPGAGLFSLPGTGTYRCQAADIDRQHGRIVLRSYKRSLPLRDQAVGFATVGKAVRVSTSVHPGQRGPLGVNANVRLGQPNTCQLSGLPVSVEAARAVWPGKAVTATSLAGASARIASSGSLAKAFPVNPSEGLSPGVKIQATVRWKSAIVIVPALKR